MPIIETESAASPWLKPRIGCRLVAAAYCREFGENTRSDSALATLRATLATNADDHFNDYLEYLGKLLSDIPNITPSGSWAPK